MNAWLKPYMLAAVALGLSTLEGDSAESKTYHFQDGTVVVTPRDSQLVPPPAPRANATLEPAATNETRIVIRPVSLNQPSPTPLPDLPSPAPVPAPNPGNNAPPLQSAPSSPEMTAQPGCCDGSQPVITPRPSDALPAAPIPPTLASMYRDVYNSIPFSRVEFNYYPNYRHDATMEFLFNQMRNTTINRNTGSVGYDYYGPLYGGYLGYPYYDPPAYPFSYGLRIHRSR